MSLSLWRISGGYLETVRLCEELVGVAHRRWWGARAVNKKTLKAYPKLSQHDRRVSVPLKYNYFLVRYSCLTWEVKIWLSLSQINLQTQLSESVCRLHGGFSGGKSGYFLLFTTKIKSFTTNFTTKKHRKQENSLGTFGKHKCCIQHCIQCIIAYLWDDSE